jgi:hypothetical protein
MLGDEAQEAVRGFLSRRGGGDTGAEA